MTKNKQKVSLKKAIKELNLKPDDTIFIHRYKKTNEDLPVSVKDVDSKLLSKDVKVIMKNYGGIDYNYSCYKFVLE